MSQTDFIRNPHLDGDPFFWQGEQKQIGALLIHGYTATTAEVRLIGEYLHQRGYTVLAPLLPGHGTTPAEMNRCKWQDWVNAVEQAYAQLQTHCERIVVCGESMGGVLALNLASNHPEIVRVVVYSPALFIANKTGKYFARALQYFVPYSQKPNVEPSAADARWKGYTVNTIPALVQMFNLQNDTRPRLGKIHQPVCVILGRLDKSIDLRSGEIILQEIASSTKQLHWLEKSTHCVILDCEWEQAAELTLQFIERNSH